MDVQLRTAQAADAACLSALSTQVFFDTYATQGIGPDLATEAQQHHSIQAMEQRLASHASTITVAEAQGRLVGYIEVQQPSVCPSPGVQGPEVQRLYVQRPFQGQGLGRRLLQHAEAQATAAATSHAAWWLWLTAWVGNHAALGFYAAQGYQRVGTTTYLINGQAFENVVWAKCLCTQAALPADQLGTEACATNFHLTVETEESERLKAAFTRPLRAYNLEQAGPAAYQPLIVALRDPQGRVCGGAWGFTAYSWAYIQLMVVPEGARRLGWGRQVMARAEALAAERGCHSLWLDTHEFQARGFYEKLGYKLFGELADYPRPYARFFFQKRLSP